MSLIDLLKEEGWHLSPEGLENIGLTEDSKDVKGAIRKILDFDLREIGASAFPEEFCKSSSRSETLESPVCVQLQKVRNISAPKANEESRAAPRMLKLIFTDSVLNFQCVEVEYISSLSINTPPGTKVKLKGGCINSAHNILLVGPQNIEVLGGRVAHMVEKWELNRSLAKHTRGVGGEVAPPPWIPFGQPLEGLGPQDKTFKSLQDGPKLDNIEFETQRKGAIAEAQKLSGIKKVFGGGTKPMLDANVQKIVDAGFTEEQAENILKVTRNNADRALKILQKKEGVAENKKEKNKVPENKGGRKGRDKKDDEGNTVVKPSGKISLFDFLEDKLPALPEPEKPARNPEPHTYHKEREDKKGRGSGRGGHRPGAGGPNRQNTNYQNYKHDNMSYASEGHKREERQTHPHASQPEKAPRFQKKYEADNRRQNQQHTAPNTAQENINSYPGGGYTQPVQGYYGDRRNAGDNRGNSRNYYGQQPIEALTEATANMNIQPQPNTQTRVYNNSRPNNNINQQYNNSNYTYQNKQMYNNQQMYNENYNRNNQYVNSNKQMQGIVPNGQQHQQQPQQQQQQIQQNSFYAPYPENQMKVQHEPPRQDMDPFRQNTMQDQRNNYNNRGNGFYQNNKPNIPYQNVSDQARKVINQAGEIQWNIGDRCLAKYWEDNGFYDAEITGVSARTVVVRFLAYGNHEEVLKSDCLPSNTSVAGINNYPMNREQNRPTRFQQAMYVPPAQRKA